MRYELLIFDVDGTLVKPFTLRLLPGVGDFFRLLLREGCLPPPRLAIATNQGGVGLRYWMETDRSLKRIFYPTEKQVEERLTALVKTLAGGQDGSERIAVYAAYAYRDKEGQWGPQPTGIDTSPRWQIEWRKPGAGMLLQAMRAAGTGPEKTLMVGDSPEDQAAAQAAGCGFYRAGDFFANPWQRCEDLKSVLNINQHEI